ncbi:choice-of-anchor D domain-containing protein [Brevifollis gellanilyticus]|uniref:RCC1 domain-containing protein n=1 Tax=Brevifollis gellanilyticus TaxID=748831 RepID=UPI00147918A2|nr:choice-of-anchor D domain-containing protein [Brevifollis gellanilyticus]
MNSSLRSSLSQVFCRTLPVLASLLLAAPSAQAALSATFNAAADVPVTAASYTPAGDVDFTLNFAPTPGTNLTVVKNTGVPFMVGAFTNLANGAAVNLSFDGKTYPFVAWYYGGEGNNDLVLLWAHTKLAAWGWNEHGTLGDGTLVQRDAPVMVDRTGVLADKTIVQVSCGTYHTLALTTEGRVYAWGKNGFLGFTATTPGSFSLPAPVNTDSGVSALHGKTVVAVAAGGDSYSLALCSDGSLVSWGYNPFGQLGDNSQTSREMPVLVNTTAGLSALAGKTVTSIAAGESFNLALCSDGSLVSWGRNHYGQLGDNSQTNRWVPVLVDRELGRSALAGKAVRSLAAAASSSLVLCEDGSVVGWGLNQHGNLGDGTMTNRLTPTVMNTEAGVSFLHGRQVTSLVAGQQHTIILCSDGTLAACGWAYQGRLGMGPSETWDRSVFPRQVNAISGQSALFGKTVTALSAGLTHSMALCSDGTVVAWGDNTYGQIGKGSTQSSYFTAVAVNTAPGTSALAGQRVTALAGSAPDARFSVVIYGVQATPEITINGNGMEIASGDTSPSLGDHTTFSGAIVQGSAVTRMFTASNSGAAPLNLTGSPQVTISGPNASDFTVTSQPASSLSFGGQSSFQVAFNSTAPGLRKATVSITNNDTDESTYVFTIQGVGVSPDFTFNSASDVPITTDGLYASGTVQLTLNFAPAPGTNLTVVKNTGTSFIQGTFAGVPNGGTVNLTYDGKTYPFVAWYYGGEGSNDLVLLWAKTFIAGWGDNQDYQLTGSFPNTFPPVKLAPTRVDRTGVLEGKTIVQLAMGDSHCLALTTEGKVYSWGSSYSGQLGYLGGDGRSAYPVQTDAGSSLAGKTVVAIAAGANHSLALCSDGTVSAWGSNTQGQLGAAGGTQLSIPVQVNNIGVSALMGKTVTAITAGRFHSVALCSDGKVAAWGSNSNAQLGNGFESGGSLPRAVVYGVLAEKTVLSVKAGPMHTLALCSDGTLVSWGSNLNGSLGIGTTGNPSEPVAVSTAEGSSALFGKTVVSMAAADQCLALCSDGTVAEWGRSLLSPVAVSTVAGVSALHGKTVTAVAVGSGHNLALCSDGSLASWGANSRGQLGDNSTTTRSVPGLVSTEEDVSVLAGLPVTGLPVSLTDSESSVAIFTPSPPEIQVSGLFPGTPSNTLVEIVDGDTTPSPADLTEFEPVLLQESAVHDFSISNRGIERLTLNPNPPFGELVTIGGPNPGNFSFVLYNPNNGTSPPPLPTTITSRGLARFRLSFTPNGLGVRTATVTIRSNDPDEDPYTFVVRGTGVTPEIEIRESGNNVASGSTFALGEVAVAGNSQSFVKTFVINNLGTADLRGRTNIPSNLQVTKYGENADDFTVLTQPAGSVAPGGSTTFTIQGNPSHFSTRTATLEIENNDLNEGSYFINLTMSGVSSSAPIAGKESVTGISFDGATLKAEVNGKGHERQVYFEYGTTNTYGSRVEATPGTVTAGPTQISAVLSGLLPNTTYHFRAGVAGPVGSAVTKNKTFTTLNRLPVALADSAVVLPGGQVVIPVLANDTDPGDVLNIASFTQPAPAVGKVTKVGNTLVFTAAASFNGGTFSYAAGDANRGKSTAATVTLTLGSCEIGPDVTIPADSPPYALTVTANAPWGVIENTSWLSFLPPAANATSVTFIPAPNASKTSRTATVNVGGKTHTVTQSGVSAVPVLTVPPFIPQAAISANYELAIPTENGPVTYTATNLPKGLTLSNATGKITGYPTEAKTSSVTVKAKNVQGDSSSISFNITVLDIPASVVGSFSALVEDDTALTDKLGGFMTMTVTKTGGVTGTLKLGAGSHPFTGRLNTAETPAAPDPLHPVLRTSVKRAGRPNVELLVRMNDDETDLISGEVTLAGAEPASLELEGSRHVWDAKTKPADNYQGYYTVALQPTSTAADIPQGDGFLTMTVTPAGAVSWSGQLADGTVMPAQTCTLWADGRVPLFIVFGKGLGSLTQSLTISSATRAATGPLRWHKKPQVVRAYADGFGNATLQASGGKYVPPGPNKTILGLNAPALVNLDFKSGGIEDASQFVPSISFSISTQHQGSRPAEGNPAQIKLTKIDVVKGTYMGTMTLKDPNPFNASLPQVSRPVTFQGVLVPHLNFGTGYFLLPAIAGPPVDVTKSPTLSGRVQITTMP